jgi:mono/diheme cytochrome c family protein
MSIVGKVFKWLGIVVGAVIVIILLVVGYIYWKSGSIVGKKYTFSVARAVYVPSDSATVARGEHLASAVMMCMECHGKDFGGAKVVDQPVFARIYGPNLTKSKSGRGVGGPNYDIKTFDRAVRHGIMQDGRGVYIMPSMHFTYLSDDDLAALFAYVSNRSSVDREVPPFTLGPIGKMLVATGKLPPAWAEIIQHNAPRPAKPAQGATKEYGQYIARLSCIGCHRPDLSGGVIEDGDPAWPPSSNLTSVLKKYTFDDFKKVLTEGERLGGNPVSVPMANAVQWTGLMDDYEIQALWLYLKDLPEVPTASASWFTTKTP